MIKVSFVIPAYKRRFLKESIDSILSQTYRNFELVIVDDKSPEGLYEVLQAYAWEKNYRLLDGGGKRWIVDGIPVRYYQNKINLGRVDLVAAWNLALSYAEGDFAVMSSDDDIYSSEYLKEMVLLSKKYPQVDLFHCRIAGIDDKGDWLWIGGGRPEYEQPIEMAYSTAVLRVAMRAPEVMFRRSALQKLGGFCSFPKAWYSDLGTWILLSKEHGACCSNRILFLWRESGINISNVHNDAVEKIHATLQFEKLFKEIVGLIPAEDHATAQMKELAQKLVSNSNLSVIRHVVARSSLRVWIKVLRMHEFSGRVKSRFLFDRFLQMFRK